MLEYALNSTPVILRYQDLPDDDLPILFIHGLGCASSLDYAEVIAQPRLSNHRRILVDLLSPGYSDRPDQFDYSAACHADYLEKLVGALKLESLVVYGHSMGGAVAIVGPLA